MRLDLEHYGRNSNYPDFFRGSLAPEAGKAAFRDRVTKKQVNMMLDQDIINYYKGLAGGRGYQTLINQALREAMAAHDLKETLRELIREELVHH